MQDLPLGFGMALAQNPDAMQYFCTLSEDKQQEIINHIHQIHSHKEMTLYVQKISQKHFF